MSLKEKNFYPEKDINKHDSSLDKKGIGRDNNVQVYDNDDAYMLNFEKENNNDENDPRENISDLDNYEKLKEKDFKEKNNMNFSEEIDDQIEHRKGFDNLNTNSDKLSKNYNNTNHTKKDNAFERNEENIENSNLITLKYISVCQCCKNNFNSNKNTPFLLKCGHFFCKFCLENNYTDEEGKVYCPEDGCIAKNISELRLLNNLIIDKTKEEVLEKQEDDCCPNHPGQKYSHYIEDTKEIICVYCAFNKFKKNPRLEIKEIKEKCGDVMDNIDKILNDNQQHADILHDTLNDIKKNKINEEQRVVQFYDKIIKYLEQKKTEVLENINIIFSQNAEKLSEKLDHFSIKMQDAEDLKANIISVTNGESSKIHEIIDSYSQYLRESNDTSKLNLELTEYKFSHDDENKFFKYLNNFGDLKSKQKIIRFSNMPNQIGIPSKYFYYQIDAKTVKRNNDINLSNNQFNNNLLNSDILDSSQFEDYEKEEYGRANTQGKHSYKYDSKERLKNDLMPNPTYDSRRRDNLSQYGVNRANNLNPNHEYLNNFSGHSNEYGFNLNRYDKNY